VAPILRQPDFPAARVVPMCVLYAVAWAVQMQVSGVCGWTFRIGFTPCPPTTNVCPFCVWFVCSGSWAPNLTLSHPLLPAPTDAGVHTAQPAARDHGSGAAAAGGAAAGRAAPHLAGGRGAESAAHPGEGNRPQWASRDTEAELDLLAGGRSSCSVHGSACNTSLEVWLGGGRVVHSAVGPCCCGWERRVATMDTPSILHSCMCMHALAACIVADIPWHALVSQPFC
jgi:hypothetical protein